MNTGAALAYLREHGDALARARAAALVEGTPPPPEIVVYLEGLPGPTGGWPLRLEPGQPESVADTCEALLALQDLGLEGHPLAQRGIDYLLVQQEADGAWQDRGPERQPPPRWLRRGEEDGRLYLTALVSSLLVTYGRMEGSAGDRALDLLLKHQLPGGTFSGFPRHTTWYALPILARRLGQRSGPAQNALLALSRALGEKGWFSSMFAAMVRNLLVAGFGLETPLLRSAWEQLLLRQREDGSWASEEGETDVVRTTLEVLWCWNKLAQP